MCSLAWAYPTISFHTFLHRACSPLSTTTTQFTITPSTPHYTSHNTITCCRFDKCLYIYIYSIYIPCIYIYYCTPFSTFFPMVQCQFTLYHPVPRHLFVKLCAQVLQHREQLAQLQTVFPPLDRRELCAKERNNLRQCLYLVFCSWHCLTDHASFVEDVCAAAFLVILICHWKISLCNRFCSDGITEGYIHLIWVIQLSKYRYINV